MSQHKHLKYAYLDEQETLPVIVVSNLTNRQEEDLLGTLRRYRETIGWTMADIKGLSPKIVQHRIHLNEGVKSKRVLAQRPITLVLMMINSCSYVY